jgi:hypothetical protein
VNTSNLKAVLDLSEIDWTGTRLVELDIEGLLPREVRLDKIPEILNWIRIKTQSMNPIPLN